MKTFAKQLLWSTVYVTAPVAVLVGGAKWNSILTGDFFFLQW